MVSYEIIPPIVKDGRTSVVGINLNEKEGTITISHHSNPTDEDSKEKLRSPGDFASVTLPIEQLKWLAPRLDGIRKSLKIANGYDEKKPPTKEA